MVALWFVLINCYAKFSIVCRLTSTLWPSPRQESGCTSTRRWPTAVAVCLLSSQRTSVWASEFILLKWLSGDEHVVLLCFSVCVKEKKKVIALFHILTLCCFWLPRGDHTFADSYLTVVPRSTEFVVFSIDGSFAASVSIMGSDPKVRAGAVDVVRYLPAVLLYCNRVIFFFIIRLSIFLCFSLCRHWQDLGYLIIYVTGRPDMQKQRVVAWLSQHNFPHGIVSFCDGLVHDPLRHKANFLKTLTEVRPVCSLTISGVGKCSLCLCETEIET